MVEKNIYIANIIVSFQDFPSKSGLAVCVFFSGCNQDCRDCQSPLLKKHDYGTSYDFYRFENLIREISIINLTKQIVFTGGDPMYNKYTKEYIKLFLARNLDYEVCIYTGQALADIKEQTRDWDYLPKYWKLGKFHTGMSRKSFKDDEKLVLASPNQNFYNKDFKQISKKGILYFNNSFLAKVIRRFKHV